MKVYHTKATFFKYFFKAVRNSVFTEFSYLVIHNDIKEKHYENKSERKQLRYDTFPEACWK